MSTAAQKICPFPYSTFEDGVAFGSTVHIKSEKKLCDTKKIDKEKI